MLRKVFLCFIFISFCYSIKSGEEQRLYLATERPVVTSTNPKYLTYANMTTRRYGRRNPLYYVNLHFTSLIYVDNNVTINFWFYEYYHSQYRRSFLELSFKWCNLVYKDAFFGPAMRRNLPKSCPHKPGSYHLYNMTVSMDGVPNLPFTKGRIYANATYKQESIVSAYIDMELKRRRQQSSH